jgi:hypothetical protein
MTALDRPCDDGDGHLIARRQMDRDVARANRGSPGLHPLTAIVGRSATQMTHRESPRERSRAITRPMLSSTHDGGDEMSVMWELIEKCLWDARLAEQTYDTPEFRRALAADRDAALAVFATLWREPVVTKRRVRIVRTGLGVETA